MSEKSGNNVLFMDINYTHKVETQTPVKPKNPLSKEERLHIENAIFKKCRAAYIRRFKRSGLKNTAYDYTDLENDAWIHFQNILDKFDKSAYPKNSIGTEVIEGKKKQKTIEWFFYNYYCRRLNLTAKENRDIKNKIMGSEATLVSGSYVDGDRVEETRTEAPEIVDIFKREISKQEPVFQEYLKQKLFLEIPLAELKSNFANFKDLNERSKDFIKGFKAKYKEFAALSLKAKRRKDYPGMRKKKISSKNRNKKTPKKAS